MKKRKVGMVAAALSIGAVLAAACGQDVREMTPERPPDLTILKAAGEYQYDWADSPEALADRDGVRVVVMGTVEEIERGRDIYYGEMEPLPSPYLVMRVRVSETFKAGSNGEIHDERVYVEILQGPIKPEDGSPGVPISEWQEAIPVGTPVMLFLHENIADQNGKKTENEDRGRPDGAKLMTADPQGMIFEYNGRIVSSDDGQPNPWGLESLDAIAERLRKHLN